MNKEIVQQRRIALVKQHQNAVVAVQRILGAIAECDAMAQLLDEEEKLAAAKSSESKEVATKKVVAKLREAKKD